MQEHVNDPYVQQAKKDGWRSRAAFKLLEIDAKDKLLKRGEVVVDLGATPGGWSQVAVQCVGESGLVLALDLLEMAPIRGVHFIQGDFREDAVLTQLEEALGENFMLVTQNIDNLHQSAGSSAIIELHGNGTRWRTSDTAEPADATTIKMDAQGIQRDPQGRMVRPDIVLYGEMGKERIAALGLGAMGLPMATHLARTFEVRAFDIASQRAQLAADAGA